MTETSTQVKNLASLPDEEFESLTKTVDHVACMRYAIRKKQTRKEGQELFKAIKARDPVGSEINSFSREIRIGEFLMNLTYAYNKECLVMEMSSILRNNTILVQELEEMERLPFWIISKYKPATMDTYIKQDLWTIDGVAAMMCDILRRIRVTATESPKNNKRTGPTGSSSNGTRKKQRNN